MELQNVVASVDLAKRLVLEDLLVKLPDSEYQPDTFPGLVYRIQKPNATFLIFQTGKIIAVGNKTIPNAKKAVKALVAEFRKLGISMPNSYKVKIENIVVSDSIGKKIDIDRLVFKLDGSEYTPDTFPGVIYRIENPKASFLIFSSGKLICAGASSLSNARKALEELKKRLKDCGAM
jgi:transcription initiation factor TFIID TATA-box-binding protein